MRLIPHPYSQILALSSGSNGVCEFLRHASHEDSLNNQLCHSLLCPFTQGQSVGPVGP